jgi:hypothetical protein
MNQPPTQPMVMGAPVVVVQQPVVVAQVPPVSATEARKQYNVWGEPHTYPSVECTCGRWLMWDAMCDVFLCCLPQKMTGNTSSMSICCQWFLYCLSLPLLVFLAFVSFMNFMYSLYFKVLCSCWSDRRCRKDIRVGNIVWLLWKEVWAILSYNIPSTLCLADWYL